MTAYELYFDRIQQLFEEIKESEWESISKAAQLMSDTILNKGVIRIFGTGHSHMIGEDALFRAGGLVPVIPISESHLMLHEGPMASSAYERMSGIAEVIFHKYSLGQSDTLVIVSNSGVNAVPVEMGKLAKQHGLKTVGIVSVAYCNETAKRKGIQETLLDYVDVVVDNHLPPGDALVEITNGWRMGPGSTIAGSMLMHLMLMTTAERLRDSGVEPPILISSNMPGGVEHNNRLLKTYRGVFQRL